MGILFDRGKKIPTSTVDRFWTNPDPGHRTGHRTQKPSPRPSPRGLGEGESAGRDTSRPRGPASPRSQSPMSKVEDPGHRHRDFGLWTQDFGLTLGRDTGAWDGTRENQNLPLPRPALVWRTHEWPRLPEDWARVEERDGTRTVGRDWLFDRGVARTTCLSGTRSGRRRVKEVRITKDGPIANGR
jgi:hypothetical protein